MEAREAALEIRALPVTIKPPHGRARLPQVTLRSSRAANVKRSDGESANTRPESRTT